MPSYERHVYSSGPQNFRTCVCQHLAPGTRCDPSESTPQGCLEGRKDCRISVLHAEACVIWTVIGDRWRDHTLVRHPQALRSACLRPVPPVMEIAKKLRGKFLRNSLSLSILFQRGYACPQLTADRKSPRALLAEARIH